MLHLQAYDNVVSRSAFDCVLCVHACMHAIWINSCVRLKMEKLESTEPLSQQGFFCKTIWGNWRGSTFYLLTFHTFARLEALKMLAQWAGRQSLRPSLGQTEVPMRIPRPPELPERWSCTALRALRASGRLTPSIPGPPGCTSSTITLRTTNFQL